MINCQSYWEEIAKYPERPIQSKLKTVSIRSIYTIRSPCNVKSRWMMKGIYFGVTRIAKIWLDYALVNQEHQDQNSRHPFCFGCQVLRRGLSGGIQAIRRVGGQIGRRWFLIVGRARIAAVGWDCSVQSREGRLDSFERNLTNGSFGWYQNFSWWCTKNWTFQVETIQCPRLQTGTVRTAISWNWV